MAVLMPSKLPLVSTTAVSGATFNLAGAKILSRTIHADAQTTDFTCGPACLLMAMAALRSQRPPSRREELRLWLTRRLLLPLMPRPLPQHSSLTKGIPLG